MDSMRGFGAEAPYPDHDDEPAMEYPPEIGFDERRMHVRAYNYWVSLLQGRPYPSIQDLDPANIEDFGSHSVLLDFSVNRDDPQIAFLGRTLRGECELADSQVRYISQVPARSLLSRLTDHYMQIIANHAPIGFEAEFVSQRGLNTLYRGILMPLSSNGEEIDFVYGVINWKELADDEIATDLAAQVDRAIAAAPAAGDSPVWADGPNADFDETANPAPSGPTDQEPGFWPTRVEEDHSSLPDDAGLADQLSFARELAERAVSADHRSRGALYRALGIAYDFALAAEQHGEEYAELLEDSGLKAQVRAPMTPIVKLVFGADYDKSRLTEFAAALSWARREGVEAGAFTARIESQEGGLKGIVRAERLARRPAPRPDRSAEIRERLRSAPAFAHVEVEVDGEDEFVLLVARRESDGGFAIIAPIADRKLTDQAIRKSAA